MSNEQTFIKIYSKHKPGKNVSSDGNCGLYALVNAINDNKNNKIILLANILKILNLSKLPNYWWHDDQLASIANVYGFDTYIYSDKTKYGYVYGTGHRPYIILYSLNSELHWCPGMLIKNNKQSNKIPIKTIYTHNYISLEKIINIFNKIENINNINNVIKK